MNSDWQLFVFSDHSFVLLNLIIELFKELCTVFAEVMSVR